MIKINQNKSFNRMKIIESSKRMKRLEIVNFSVIFIDVRNMLKKYQVSSQGQACEIECAFARLIADLTNCQIVAHPI